MMRNNYLLKYHVFFIERVKQLIDEVEKLSITLPREKYLVHESTKLLARITRAHIETIPANPNLPDYYLKGVLAKFRRYKRGLQRYRLLFCFANTPPIIVYLYCNDKDHLRKDGSKTDPYNEFVTLVNRGIFSHDPQDPNMQKWIKENIALC